MPFTPPAPPSESSAQAVDGFDADTDDYDENAPSDDEIRKAVRDAVDAVTEVDGLPLYEDESERRIDPAVDVPAEPGDDLEWGDDKPEAPTRELAVAAFDKALLELSGDPALRDPADPSGQTVIISPALLLERYPFRERPWFSAELSLLADGERIAPPGLSLSRAEDLGLRAGKYRLNRLPGS